MTLNLEAAAQRAAQIEGNLPRFRFWGSSKPPKDYEKSKLVVALAAVQVTPEPGAAATTDGPTAATIRVYGPIDDWGGWWGVSAKDVSSALDDLPESVTQLQLRINSPGGLVSEALAILNMLRAHRTTVTAVVDGMAASAASVIAAGCDKTVMSPGTQMMIHDARCFVYGPPKDMRKVAEILDSTSNSLAELYTEAAGGTVAGWREAMAEETWYTANEAVAAKLADEVGVVKDVGTTQTAEDPDPLVVVVPDEEIEDSFDLSIYSYAGRSSAPAPTLPSASAAGSTTEGGTAVAFSDEQMTDLRQKLGITDENADEATILAALDEVLEEQTAPSPSPTPTPTAPAGTVLVDEGVLAQLQLQAKAGSEARARQLTEDRDTAVSAAARDGRITSASIEDWTTRWDADPKGTAELLDRLPAGLVPLEERGHANPSNQTADESLYSDVMAGWMPETQQNGA